MKIPVQGPRRYVAGFLILMLSAPFGETAIAQQEQSTAGQQQTTPAQQTQSPAPEQVQPAQQPIAANDSREMPDAPTPAESSRPAQAQNQSQQQQNPPADATGQQNSTPAVGTAAAPLERPSGVAASRPVGAAIAPAKQRRVRTFLISVGVVIGAGVAIGTVAALSHASPSRP